MNSASIERDCGELLNRGSGIGLVRSFRRPASAAVPNATDYEPMPGIIGNSAALTDVLAMVRTVSPTDATVLITGESGTGKELVAHAIHELSDRHSNGFITMNCAAIPTDLLERELFGHERGAFTGAVASQIGRFEAANRGTLFLDEIAELPLALQPKLLRVLEQREFERLGSVRTIRTDARLIAATNCDLEARAWGAFRADLFYRLNVFSIHVPPLRERPEDIPILVRHFVQVFSTRAHRVIETIPSSTMDVLTRYRWPGNVRELKNLVERSVILSSGPVLEILLRDFQICTSAPAAVRLEDSRTLEGVERAHILSTLSRTGWVLSGPNGAAAILGITRSKLQNQIKRLGIDPPRPDGPSRT